MDALTSCVQDYLFLRFKIIGNDQIHYTWVNNPDVGSFFCEPILYKEVEWIEIPMQYEDYKNENNKKAGMKTYVQDLKTIENAFTQVGQFQYESNDKMIKIWAYK